MKERLQKVIAQAGLASRRKAEELIEQGKVKVNGQVVREQGLKVDPVEDKIEVSGKLLKIKDEKVYFLLNKPKGYVTTASDPQGRPTVLDLIKTPTRVYPVGRLDFATEGLLLLTNDGNLTYQLTHPSHEIEKVYHAMVRGIPKESAIRELQRGVLLDDGMTAPAKVKVLKQEGGNTLLEVIIHEGRNRQVRRMCENIGHPVIRLERVALGNLTLQGVKRGKYRSLSEKEVMELKNMV